MARCKWSNWGLRSPTFPVKSQTELAGVLGQLGTVSSCELCTSVRMVVRSLV